MSEPKLISPLLDGFSMGNSISNHDGVCCCPAMKENSDDKYIVKVISVPASQVQLEALLLTGAYKDPAAATDYFKDLADDVVKEAKFLKKVAKLEGFLPYESWQIVPMEDNRLGYDVYLVTSYKHSLKKYMSKNLMTHLGAVNLGLDMCAALAICRKAGCLYTDLKPSNIFISDDKEYRIGDLGFMEMSSLKYASLPSKYRSPYTAPELHDPMATLNTTVDIYALGLILYQIYNNGKLPFEGCAPAEVFPTPENADYEIAEIILKACAPTPEERWKNPIEMGQALVAYMQRNSINDVPITPPSVAVAAAISAVEKEPAQETVSQDEIFPALQEDPAEEDQFAFFDQLTSDESAPSDEDAPDGDTLEMSEELSSIFAQADDLIAHETPEGVTIPDAEDISMNEDLLVSSEIESGTDDADVPEETASGEESFPVETEPADESEKHSDTQDETSAQGQEDILEDTLRMTYPTDDEMHAFEDEDEDDDDDLNSNGKKKRGWIAIIIIALILALLGTGGMYFYRNYYLMRIDGLDVKPHENQVTVLVDTDIDTTLLTAVCTDSYGNSKSLPLTYGQAVFTELLPDTQYKLHLEIEGFHHLVGSTSNTFSTPAVTNIVSFTAVTGSEDGSVMLNFTVDGPDAEEWTISYGTEGESKKEVSITGHMITITGLTVGKTYSFQLVPDKDLYMTGEYTLDFTASKLITAENLTITDCTDGKLTAQWTVAEDCIPESWIVQCYSDDGYLESVETTETSVTFPNIDASKAYTIEVLASGMTQSVRTGITANPIKLNSVTVNDEESGKLTVSWEFEGETPEGGWLLMYTLDGSETQEVVTCDTNSGVIEPRIPGATYDFVIQAANSVSVFGNTYSYESPNAAVFSDKDLAVYDTNIHRNLNVNMLATPIDENWSYKDVKKGDYTTSFTSGQEASLLLHFSMDFYVPHQDTSILYVIRDAEGNVITNLIAHETRDWYDMWWNADYHYCELDIPAIPREPGEYSLSLYINHMAVTSVEFTVTE